MEIHNKRCYLTFLLIIVTTCLPIGYSQYINVEITRKFNLTSHSPEVNIDVSFRKTSSTTISNKSPYLIAIRTNAYQNIAYMNVSSNNNNEILEVNECSDVRPDGYELYEVKYHDDFAADITTLKIHMVFADVYEYLPQSIQQDDNQLVVYSDTRIFPSPYLTEKQITIVTLSSHHIEEVSEDNNLSIDGDTVTYGPYINVKAYGDNNNNNAAGDGGKPSTNYHEPIRMHFENNNPSIFSKIIESEINIYSETNANVNFFVELENHGSNLQGGFSRLDHQMRRLDYVGPSFQQIQFKLLRSSVNVKCKDDLGNLTKSYVDYNTTRLILDTRYPLFGGWKTDFTINYDVKLTNEIVDNDRNKKVLIIDFSPPISNGIVKHFVYTITFKNGFVGKNMISLNKFVQVDKYYMNERNEFVLKLSNVNKIAGGMVYHQNKYFVHVSYQ